MPGAPRGDAGSDPADADPAPRPASDASGDAAGDASGDAAGDASGDAAGGGRSGSRDVVVPMRIYKLVTVLTTLIAVPTVVLGFVFLDAATLQVSVMRRLVVSVLAALGLAVDPGALAAGLGVAGLLLIGLGAGVYVLGARFRAAGMGNAQEDADEPSGNG